MIWVTGEAGIGKTAVVEAFRSRGSTGPPVWLAAGQCVEHYGTEKPTSGAGGVGAPVPWPGRERLVALLHQHAPTWLVQMPWLLTAAHREQLHDELQGATRERMLREFAEVVDTLTAETPLILSSKISTGAIMPRWICWRCWPDGERPPASWCSGRIGPSRRWCTTIRCGR